jgi:hypothetical protein
MHVNWPKNEVKPANAAASTPSPSIPLSEPIFLMTVGCQEINHMTFTV